MNNNGKTSLSSILLIIAIITFVFLVFSTYLYFAKDNKSSDIKASDTKEITNNEDKLLNIIEDGFDVKLKSTRYYINKNNNNEMFNITKKYFNDKDDFTYFIPSFVTVEDSNNVGNNNYTEFQCVHPACESETRLKNFFKKELGMSKSYIDSYISKINSKGLLYSKNNLMYVKNIKFNGTSYKNEVFSKSFLSNNIIYVVLNGYNTDNNKSYYKIFKFITENKKFKVDGYYIEKID